MVTRVGSGRPRDLLLAPAFDSSTHTGLAWRAGTSEKFGMHAASETQIPLPGTLAPNDTPRRLQALMATEKKLLSKVAGAQTRFRKFAEKIEDLQTRLHVQGAPFLQRCQVADEEIHKIFTKLLDPTDRRLGKRAKQKVRKVYLDLQANGAIGDRRSSSERSEAYTTSGSTFDDFESDPFSNFWPATPSANPEHLEQPPHKGREQESTRAVFRKLADLLHPDKAPKGLNDAERGRREAAMKEATAAYGDGDLARLLWIEKAWVKSDVAMHSAPSALEARCEGVSKRIQELERQAEDLKYDLQDLRKSMLGRAVADAQRVGMARVLEEMCAELKLEQDDLEHIAAFVSDFRDGRMSLEAFLEGPLIGGDDDLDVPFPEVLLDFLEFVESQGAAPRSASERKPNRKRTKRRK